MFQGAFWFFVSWNRQVLCVESAVVIAIEAKVDCLPIIQNSVFSLIWKSVGFAFFNISSKPY